MKIKHNIFGRFDDKEDLIRREFDPAFDARFSHSLLLDDQLFRKIEPEIMQSVRLHLKIAEFEKSEVENSKWVALLGLTAHGYPQPEGTWRYGDNFDMSSACADCRSPIGPQTKPIRIKSDARVRPLFSLEWLHGDLFASREFYNEYLKPIGLNYRSVVIHRTGLISETLVQIVIPVSEWSFDFSEVPFEKCEKCGQKKYLHLAPDYLPPLIGNPPSELFSGPEMFGTGASTFRRIYFSNRLFELLRNQKLVRWHQFMPLKDSTS